MFAAAPSQNETLAALTMDPDIDWGRIHAFHMDEYIGLDAAHPAGFGNFLNRSLFGLKPFGSVSLLNGQAEDVEDEAERYQALLEAHPWISACWASAKTGISPLTTRRLRISVIPSW